MTKGYLIKIIVSFTMMLTAVKAQENVDAIEKARQAKEAADKAAAEAAAATSAAIEAAAAKAAKEAREEAKRKKEEEEARKIAEAKAAEEAELDAAAAAAAEEAKRKMAAELGLEVDDPEVEEAVAESTIAEATVETEEVIAREALGWNVGAAASIGLVKGESFSGGLPTGGTLVITTPFGFKIGPFDYTVSLGLGGYSGSSENEDGTTFDFNPSFAGIGGNLTLANFIFAEGHLGSVGEGTGIRGFAGVTLERLMKKGLNLPFNFLIGSEVFYSTDMAGVGNPSGWAAVGVRLDYGF
tara:strand:+ start:1911 stop:2804 length:894 start_codon:yes stop_codon:yes gene_type:complete